MGPSIFACWMARRKSQKDATDARVQTIWQSLCEDEDIGPGLLGGIFIKPSSIMAEVQPSQGRIPRIGTIHALLAYGLNR
jgi:hypothetical protein